ncbi:HdeD family acid-resistance protein [Nocardia sp. NPDC052566]|uniref:HdeD family acid-resistance protein n=1 Tax=Nocardia sp. NPDC052566 TaxID=3364330 RepID=UPI0037C9AF9D
MTTNSVLEGPLHSLARSAWQTVLVTGILAVILGVIILVWPGPTLLAAGILFGIYLVVSGFLQLMAAFGVPSSAGVRVLAFISGVLSIAIGVFCFRDDLTSILLLGLWIGIGWLFRGIAIMMMAISEPSMPGRGWNIFFGLINAIAGVVLIVWPLESVATLALVVGVWLVVLGIMEIILSFGVRKDAKELLDNPARAAAL